MRMSKICCGLGVLLWAYVLARALTGGRISLAVHGSYVLLVPELFVAEAALVLAALERFHFRRRSWWVWAALCLSGTLFAGVLTAIVTGYHVPVLAPWAGS